MQEHICVQLKYEQAPDEGERANDHNETLLQALAEGNVTNGGACGETLFTQVRNLRAAQKTALAAVAAAASALTFLCACVVQRCPTFFPTGPLTAAQLMMLHLCLGAVCLQLAVWLRCFQCSPEAACRVGHFSELSAYLLLMFVCDRTRLLQRRSKTYDGDFFAFLTLALFVVGLGTIAKVPPASTAESSNGVVPHEASAAYHVPPLTRLQTEEWKGWMQVLFLWYHYFHNVRIYNGIRLFVAAYMWMTGLGNFLYYHRQRDFSLARFCQMQWRLNVLALCVCLMMRNEYMLYYICPLHTFFTVVIYATLGVRLRMGGGEARAIYVKLMLLLIAALLLWDLPFSPRLFEALWTPLKWLVRYDDPYNPNRGVFAEWFFRSFLDHLIWMVGMLTAYLLTAFEAYLTRIDALKPRDGVAVKVFIAGAALWIGAIYYKYVLCLSKVEYNRVHPYTSFIPITLVVVLRNLFQCGRMYHVRLFSALGKITLETYILQYHIWMATTGVNGSPKLLLRILPGDFPKCDFGIATIGLVAVSYRVHYATAGARTTVFPSKAPPLLIASNALLLCLVGVVSWLLGCLWTWLLPLLSNSSPL